MNHPASPFYPRRARWYSPLLLRADRLRWRLALDRIPLSQGVSLRGLMCCLLVPGLGFYLRWRRWGKAALGLGALLALAFVYGLGSTLGNVAFGLLLSLHVTGVSCLFEPWLAGQRLRARFLFSCGVLLLLAGCLYLPVRNLIQEHWLMPLQVKGRVVIVRPVPHGYSPARGEWLAYSYTGFGAHGLQAPGGLGLAPILARPGDHVRFTVSAVEVNGVPQPRRALMPGKGEWVVPEKHWFVWPEVAIGGNGPASPEVISAALCQLGTITEAQFVGRPCQRWFWRRQL